MNVKKEVRPEERAPVAPTPVEPTPVAPTPKGPTPVGIAGGRGREGAPDPKPAPARPDRRILAEGVSEGVTSVKFAFHAALAVTDRLIGGLMKAYRSVFVLDESQRTDFDKVQGFAYFDKKDYRRAVESFRACLASNGGNDTEVLFHMGLAHAHMEEYTEAIDCFRGVDALLKDDCDVVVELATCFLKTEDYAQASEYLGRGMELDPANAELRYMLGSVREKTEEWDAAVESYRSAIELDPKQPLYYHALGFAYESSGNHEDAITCFRQAMELERADKKR